MKKTTIFISAAIIATLVIILISRDQPDMLMYQQEVATVKAEETIVDTIMLIPEYYSFEAAFNVALEELGQGEDKLFKWRNKIYKVVLK